RLRGPDRPPRRLAARAGGGGEGFAAPGGPEVGVGAGGGEELGVGADGDDAAVVEHHHPVGDRRLGEPGGDHPRRAAGAGAVGGGGGGGGWGGGGGGGAARGARLVEDRHRRVDQGEPGERHVLGVGGAQRRVVEPAVEAGGEGTVPELDPGRLDRLPQSLVVG